MKCVNEVPEVSANSLQALINMCDNESAMSQMLEAGGIFCVGKMCSF